MIARDYLEKLASNRYVSGSYLAYLDTMSMYAKRGGISEQVLVAFVLNGLPRNITNVLIMNNKESLSWKFLYMSCRDLHLQEVENVGSRQQLYEVREDNRS
ncbi:hypothetical protein NGRA_3363, partial [Nosema granulosis]